MNIDYVKVEDGWLVLDGEDVRIVLRLSEAGLESLQQAAADLVFGSQKEQDAASEHARSLYRRGNMIGRGDLE